MLNGPTSYYIQGILWSSEFARSTFLWKMTLEPTLAKFLRPGKIPSRTDDFHQILKKPNDFRAGFRGGLLWHFSPNTISLCATRKWILRSQAIEQDFETNRKIKYMNLAMFSEFWKSQTISVSVSEGVHVENFSVPFFVRDRAHCKHRDLTPSSSIRVEQ